MLNIKTSLELPEDMDKVEDVILHFAADEELGEEMEWVIRMTTLDAHDWKTALSPYIHDSNFVRYRYSMRDCGR